VVIHQDARGEAADVLALDVVDAADAGGEVEDIVHAIDCALTAAWGSQVDGSEIDIAEKSFEGLEAASGEVVGDDDIRAALQ
jgi:hypothetical protein